MLEKNQLAPDFQAPDQNNKIINLSEFRNYKNVVLYFYPKDDTSGCTLEARQFTGLADRFSELETVVIGVSKDSCASHRQFINKCMAGKGKKWREEDGYCSFDFHHQ